MWPPTKVCAESRPLLGVRAITDSTILLHPFRWRPANHINEFADLEAILVAEPDHTEAKTLLHQHAARPIEVRRLVLVPCLYSSTNARSLTPYIPLFSHSLACLRR